MRTGRVVAALLCGWFGFGAGASYAEAPSGVLVLPTQVTGNMADRVRLQRELDEHLERAVTKSGRVTKPAGPLTAAEARCRTADCLAKLAEAAGAQIVIGARVNADRGSPPSYKIFVDRYDRDLPDAVREENADCTVCTEADTIDRIEQVVATLLPVPKPEPPPVAVAPTVSVVEPPPVVPKPSKTGLYAAVGATSAVTIGGLVMLGLGAHAWEIDDHCVGSVPCTRLYDTRGTGVALVAIGSIAAIGGLVGLTISAIKLKRAR